MKINRESIKIIKGVILVELYKMLKNNQRNCSNEYEGG